MCTESSTLMLGWVYFICAVHYNQEHIVSSVENKSNISRMAEVSRTDLEDMVHLCTWYRSGRHGTYILPLFSGPRAGTYILYLSVPFNTPQ